MARSHPVDVHVGARMRQRRTLLGMSQEKLGTAVGLTFQQIQKYERGSNRIGSSRLFEFAKVLDVPVSYFFDEMPSNALSGRPMSGRGRKGFGEPGTPFKHERSTVDTVRRPSRNGVRLAPSSEAFAHCCAATTRQSRTWNGRSTRPDAGARSKLTTRKDDSSWAT